MFYFNFIIQTRTLLRIKKELLIIKGFPDDSVVKNPPVMEET